MSWRLEVGRPQLPNQIQLAAPDFVNKIYQHTATRTHLGIVHGCFCATDVELRWIVVTEATESAKSDYLTTWPFRVKAGLFME